MALGAWFHNGSIYEAFSGIIIRGHACSAVAAPLVTQALLMGSDGLLSTILDVENDETWVHTKPHAHARHYMSGSLN